MGTMEKEKIREAVRERYGNIARVGAEASELRQVTSCCGDSGVSVKPESEGSCGCTTEFSPENISAAMGYSGKDIESVPDGANLGLGCGNPVALASIKPGETVVDLGSGGGFDCFLAADRVGDAGRVIGVDMTPDMVAKARKNAEKTKAKNVEFRLGEIEHLPVADNSADIIISNCVINLSPDKPGVYKDAFRALKPGGRLAVSDILATAEIPDDVRANLAMVSACIGGAATIEDTEKMLKETGFMDIRIRSKEEIREMIQKWAPGGNIEDYVISASIEAVKPL
ncbi:arsenite methyltransferase [Desulfococcaceae bacterium HSG7]|nr:arsenite methyltransferase [Desulfococcaceae bacterium HSG7]